MHVLGHKARRIETEYLERLNKVRFGLDRGWRPPGLMMKGGTASQRTGALEQLKSLGEGDGFFCSYVAVSPELPLSNTAQVCQAAIRAAGLSGMAQTGADSLRELERLARSARELGRNGWVVLFDHIDAFGGTPRERAIAYQEVVRWMGALPGEAYIGLFCVLAVTPEFEAAVSKDNGDLAAIRKELGSTGSAEDRFLLDMAEGGIRSLEREAIIQELLVLDWQG